MAETKAELQVKLRALARGGPGRLPISTMKKHELESYIDALTELRANQSSKTGQMYQQHLLAQKTTEDYRKEIQEVAAKAVEDAKTKPTSKGGGLGPRPVPVEEAEVEDVSIKLPGKPAERLMKAPPVNKPKVPKEPKEPKEVKNVVVQEPTGKSGKVLYCPCNCPNCPHRK